MKPTSWRISGDLGDAIYALAIMKSLGGKHVIRAVDRPGVTAPFVHRFNLLKPLFCEQEYIESAECSEDSVDIDLVPFRRWHSSYTTLIAAQSTEANLSLPSHPNVDGQLPWLSVNPDTSFSDVVIVARSPRYNNPWFPWMDIVSNYIGRIAFIGIDSEYDTFVRSFGKVDRLVVPDFLEMARSIAGCGLFIGNQSSPHAVAMGLGVDILQETCLEQPDCIYPRINVQYCADGGCILPEVGGRGGVEIKSKMRDIVPKVSKENIPPGFWQYPGVPEHTHFYVVQKMVAMLDGCSEEEAENKIISHNLKRCPEFFKPVLNHHLQTYETALNAAMKKILTPKISETIIQHSNPTTP